MTYEKDIREIVRRGEELYGAQIRPLVERDGLGKYVSIDIETGEWDMADDLLTTTDRLHAKHPGALLYSTRVGYPGLAKLGFGYRPGLRA
jgi:hypothetical protein